MKNEAQLGKRLPRILWGYFGERVEVYHASPNRFECFDSRFWNKGIGNHKTELFEYKYFQFTRTFKGAVQAGKELRQPRYFVLTVSVPKRLLTQMGMMDWEDPYDGYYPLSVGLTYCRHCVVVNVTLVGVWGHSVWKRHLGCNLLIFGSQTLRTTELGKN